MRSLQYSLLLLACYVFFSACTAQAAINAKDFYPIKYPGKLSLYYAKENQKDENNDVFYRVVANHKIFHIYGKAVKPSIQSVFLLENTVINPDDVVLDIGTGSGIQAIFAARKASHIVALDIATDAIKTAKINVKRFDLEKIIDVRLGDLFKPVKQDEKFDVIIYNIDYPEEEDVEKNRKNPLWKVHERFFSQVKNYLKPDGRIYYQSGYIFNIPHIQKLLKQNDLQIMQMKMTVSIPHKKEIVFYEVKRRAF